MNFRKLFLAIALVISLIGVIIVIYNSAFNGMAVKQVTFTPKINCFDSDNGKNYDVQGYIQYIGNNKVIKADDVCYDQNSVAEWFCSGQRDTYQNVEKHYCPNGCFKGACVTAVQQKPVKKSQRITSDKQDCISKCNNTLQDCTSKCLNPFNKLKCINVCERKMPKCESACIKEFS